MFGFTWDITVCPGDHPCYGSTFLLNAQHSRDFVKGSSGYDCLSLQQMALDWNKLKAQFVSNRYHYVPCVSDNNECKRAYLYDDLMIKAG